MRVLIAGLGCGGLGALLFLAAIFGPGELSDPVAFLITPGSMLAFALIHASHGELGYVAIAAGALLQFIIFASFGAMVGALSHVLIR